MSSIPSDLILEICSRLPPKSIARCRCVSKQWGSMLHRPNFTARPRLLFSIEQQSGEWRFFSTRQPHNPYEKSSSLVVAADFHVKFPGDDMMIRCTSCRQFSCEYASGLVYFSGMWLSKNPWYTAEPVICNPNTGQYASLPYLYRYRKSFSFLGFDPIDKQFKVLFMAYPFCSEGGDHRILTLGSGIISWREIECSLQHVPLSEGICINGVLYYLGDYESSDNESWWDEIELWWWDETWDDMWDVETHSIVCFDVRTEKFKFIDTKLYCDWSTQLINYKGNLSVIYWKYDDKDAIKLRMRVLEDFEKQEWSEHTYTLRDDKLVDRPYIISVVGVTSTTGEIVLSMSYHTSKTPFYVFYFNPERNTLQIVEIQGFGASHDEAFKYRSVYTFVDHVDVADLNVNDAELLKSWPRRQHGEEVREKDRGKMFEDHPRHERECREDEKRRRRHQEMIDRDIESKKTPQRDQWRVIKGRRRYR